MEGEINEEPEPIFEQISAHGTRNPDTVDANGPYGTGIPFDPYYEGDPITFDAQIEPEDEHENYKFRWDLDSDGLFDGPGDSSTDYFGEDGESAMTRTMYDDVTGKALVQAWDGSWSWDYYSGNVQDEPTINSYYGYVGGSARTWGWQFEVTKDSQADQIGAWFGVYPDFYYNFRIWDDTPTVIAEVLSPTMSYGDWTWHSITPVDLYAGTTYTITYYLYALYGFSPTNTNPGGPTSDGIVVPGSAFSDWGNVYPTTPFSQRPAVDFHYTCRYAVPNVIEDTAEILVWNREPSVFGPEISPTVTREGSMDAEFTAWMVDLGLMDEWEFQWDFGDGTQSNWQRIPSMAGGASVLWLHSFYGYMDPMFNPLRDELGEFPSDPNGWLTRYEEWDCGPQGGNNMPTLEYLLGFNVVIVGTTWSPLDQAGMGNLMADYVDAGGNAITIWLSEGSESWGMTGRWMDEDYNILVPTGRQFATRSLGTVYDPTHPIMDGISTLSTTLRQAAGDVETGATRLADFTIDDYVLAGYRDAGNKGPGTGRIAGLNMFPHPSYASGDVLPLMANAIKWACGGIRPTVLQQPYQLPPISHIYRDDHPTHVTPTDQFIPTVRVRDDDHCIDRVLGEPFYYDENFNRGWGVYGDNPPTDWTILDLGAPPPAAWDYNDWHRYMFYSSYPGGTGTYAARVYYYPEEDQDEELITPSIDVSGYSTVDVNYATYYNDMTTSTMDYGYVDVRFDGGSWNNVYTFSNSDEYGDMSHTITVPSGTDTMQVRWRYVAFSEYYWYVDSLEVKSGSDTLLSENFNTGWGTYGNNPPSGWTILDHGVPRLPWNYNDWHRYTYYSSYPGGDGTQGARCYYYPYENSNEWLISPMMDLTSGAYSTVNLEFNYYWYRYDGYTNSDIHVGYLKYRLDGVGSWVTIDEYHDTETVGFASYDLSVAIGHQVEILFQFVSPAFNYLGGYGWWNLDNFHFEGIPELKHVYGMSPWIEGPPVTVANVFPTVTGIENVPDVVPEKQVVTIEGLNIVDPALYEETEEFWYRWDFDDGTGTPWIYKGKMEMLDILFVHSFESTGDSGPWIDPIAAAIRSHPQVNILDFWNIGYYDHWAAPSLAYMQNYDVVFYGNNYGWYPAGWDGLREDLGDNLADYVDSGGAVATFMTTYGGNPLFNLRGRYIDDDYGPFDNRQYAFGSPTLGTVYYPNHDVMVGVEDLRSELVFSGDLPLTAGATLLADWVNGNSAIGVKEHPNGARTLHYGAASYGNGAMGADFHLFIRQVIDWTFTGVIVTPEIDPEVKTFGDNGIYNVDLQLCDDDMNWEWNPGDPQPTYVGPVTDDPMDWVSHNYMPIEVLNTDPVISPRMKAYAELDLSLRMSGTKTHEATMTLYENGVNIGETAVTRVPGSPNIGVISNKDIMVTKGFEYEIVIVVDPQGDGGANPTWLFDMVFPDGKFKQFKHTFNDEHGWEWTITSSELKGALLGHDIIFEAEADDVGSDDLAFVWNFGDSTPHGIHLYANVDQGTAVDGVSDEAVVIFDQLSNRDDPFEKPANDIRTPADNPMHVEDMISHVFDDSQPYYYYVTLIVMDDDVDDDYPSTQLHASPGCDLAFLELDFR
jgi:hypothetical protein